MRRDSVESFTVGKVKVRIEYDDDPQNPRKDYDLVGTMACWHRRYTLGDEQPEGNGTDYLVGLCQRIHPNFPEEQFEKHGDAILSKYYVILPLGLYDHSGITMYVGGTHPMDGGGWDSGQVGMIWCDLKKALHEWGVKGQEHLGWKGEANFTKKDDGTSRTLREAVETYLTGEVETYDQYLRGEVYGYVVEDEDGNHLESCWGFYGDLDDVSSDAKAAAESVNEQILEAEAKELAEAQDAACRDIATVS